MRRLTASAVIAASITIPLCADRTTIASGQTSTPMSAEAFDALVLSQGTSTDGFINQEMEAKIRGALKAIRSKFPETANLHARPSFALDTLAVGLTKQGQDVIKRKVKMTEDSPKEEPITGDTGIVKLDQLNAKYGATSVTAFYSPALLFVRFKKPMDIPVLIKIYAAIPESQATEGDEAMGDGDEIHLKRDNQVWLFAFKHGWGDCPAGCINNQYFFFSYRPDTQAVKKTGEHLGRLRDEEMWKTAEGAEKN
jgi:hypothetical protein